MTTAKVVFVVEYASMERESTVLNHREIVQPFIIAAFKEGAHRIKPRRTPQDQCFREIWQ